MDEASKKSPVFYLSMIVFLLLALAGMIVYNSLAAGNVRQSMEELQSEQGKLKKSVEELKAQKNRTASENAELKVRLETAEKDAEAAKKRTAELEQELKSINQQKVVYLTFDDGPSPVTLKILQVLKDHKVPATFFVIGTKYSDYMKNIIDDGHAIALHTFSHKYEEVYKSVDNYFADLNKIAALVKEKTGQTTNLLRFPGGGSNKVSKNYTPGIMTTLTAEVQKRGYLYFDWNVDCDDAGNGGTAETLLNNVKKNSQNKMQICLLMHDAAAKNATAEALPEIIKYFKGLGYTFSRLNEFAPEFKHTVIN